MPSSDPEPFLGKKTTFAKKYPQIKSVLVEYEQMESRLDKEERKGILTESSIPAVLPCKWKRCKKGGFAIEVQIIQRMVIDRAERLEETLRCCGHVVLDRKQHPSCPNYLMFKAVVEYHDQALASD